VHELVEKLAVRFEIDGTLDVGVGVGVGVGVTGVGVVGAVPVELFVPPPHPPIRKPKRRPPRARA
jgi:hypothetical protein